MGDPTAQWRGQRRNAAEADADEQLPLYRAEAISARATIAIGRPIAAIPLSWSILTAFIGITVLVGALCSAFMTYTRTEMVTGVLRSTGGESRVIARSAGTVSEVLVGEGAIVEQGTPLVTVSTIQTSVDGQENTDDLVSTLAEEEALVRSRLASFDGTIAAKRRALTADIVAAEAEVRAARAAHAASQERLRLAEERLDAGRLLDARGFISRDQMRLREEAVIAQRQAGVDALARAASSAARREQLRADLAQAPTRADQERGQLQAELASALSRRSAAEASRGYALRAPIRGRVTALQARVGQAVDASFPLMTLLPLDRSILAELYAPSRAIGFVRAGDPVRVRIDAYPYERFGAARGIVTAVSATTLAPGEIPERIEIREPVYRVSVELERGALSAYGEDVALQTGMRVSATIVLEERSLADWLFEPLVALRGGV